MDEGGRFEIYCGCSPTVGSNPTLSAPFYSPCMDASGEVTEWTKVRDWKSRVRQRTVGSNPTLSAKQSASPRWDHPERESAAEKPAVPRAFGAGGQATPDRRRWVLRANAAEGPKRLSRPFRRSGFA